MIELFFNFFNQNIIILYFIVVLYMLISDKLSFNKKLIIIYIISYILIVMNVIHFLKLMIIMNIAIFLYIEYLEDDEVKMNIMNNFFHKVIDYAYRMISEFHILLYTVSIFLQTNFVYNIIEKNQVFSKILININYGNINLLFLISFILLILTITFISQRTYIIESFQNIKDKMDKVTSWNKLKLDYHTLELFEILLRIEDKSFFIRNKSYNFFSFEFFKYRYNKIIDNLHLKMSINFSNLIKNENSVFLLNIIIKKIKDTSNKISKIIRGYSTIEMQLIRTLGIKEGYHCKFRRKIYEIIYSKIFFQDLRKYFKKHKYSSNCSYKEYLMYIYIYVAKIKINGIEYENIINFWEKKNEKELDLKNITNEEFFISVLGLSWRKIDKNILYNYENFIKCLNLDENKIEEIIEKIKK